MAVRIPNGMTLEKYYRSLGLAAPSDEQRQAASVQTGKPVESREIGGSVAPVEPTFAQQNAAANPTPAAVAVEDPAALAQSDLIKQIQGRISGKEKTISEMEAQKAREQAIKASMSAAASARGGLAPGALQKALMQSQAAITQQAYQQEGIDKQKELQSYAGVLEGVRTGTLTAQQLAQQQNQFAQTLQQQYSALDLQKLIAKWNRDAAIQSSNNQITGGIIGAVGAVGAGLAFASDKNLKKDIESGSEDMQDFLDAISNSKYKYKDKKWGDKEEYYSPMAQELEKTSVGKSMVINTPEGKMVDYGRGFGAILAAQADLHKRLKELEE